MQKPSDGALARIWARLGATLAPELMVRLSFKMDVQRFNEWYDADCDMSSNDGQDCPLQDLIEIPLNLEFLLAEGRCHYPIDRKLMCLLAERLSAEWGRSPDAARIDSDLRHDLAYLLFDHSEEELLEWAFHASFRQPIGINFADLASLQESFIRYAKGMRKQILRHLECVQEALMSHPSEQVGLGRTPDPLTCCITLS